MTTQALTPSQTIGPFYGFALPYPDSNHISDQLHVYGTVYDGHGEAIIDALIETLQAGPDGSLTHPNRFARSDTRSGQYHLHTYKPGARPHQAPHFAFIVHARGLLQHLHTRLYFPDHTDDPVLNAVPDHRRHTLIGTHTADGLLFDIHLQGPKETVFFDV